MATSDWLSAVRVPRENSDEELSFAARNIELLRPQLVLIGLAALCYTLFLAAKNWPIESPAGALWIVSSLLISVPLLSAGYLLSDRLHLHPGHSVQAISAGVFLLGLLWGSDTGAFLFPLGIASSLALVVVTMVVLGAVPLAQVAFMLGFAIGEVTFGAHGLPPAAIALGLVFSFGGIAISAHHRFRRAKTFFALHDGRFARLSDQKSKFDWSTNAAGNVTTANNFATQTLGIPRMASAGYKLWSLAGTTAAQDAQQKGENTLAAKVLERSHRTHAAFSDLVVNLAARDGIHRISLSGRPHYDAAGMFAGFRGAAVDLTEFSRVQERLLAAAERDALTKLMNRACFNENLEKELGNWSSGGGAVALLLIDLDLFKQANDTFGHQVGDQVLRQFADRLRSFIGADGYAARLGGDEFGVVLNEMSSKAKLAALAGELIPFLSAPYEISGVRVSIGATIGIAIAPEHGDTVDSLVRSADLALYTAKARGKNQHRFYDPVLLDHALERRRLEIDLGKAIENSELSVTYQPIVEAATDRLCGFEALVRWQHPKRGEVSPDEFIPLAEASGLIDRLGEWVLREACSAAKHWPSNVRLAVNLSPSQFRSPGLGSAVINSLAQNQLEPGRLELEITEGVFLEETPRAQDLLRQLHEFGVRWTIDDFGTGYSSLKYLLKAPISKIKIDREFLNGIGVPSSQKRPIVQAIVALANSLGMETTAEGIEAKNDLDVAKEIGCTQVQGFIYGSKLDANEARSLAKCRLPIPAEGYDATRKEQRTVVFRSADIDDGQNVWPGTVRNVSASGAMIESEWRGSVGERVSIHMDHEEAKSGRICWAEGMRFGVQFDEHSLSRGVARAQEGRKRPSSEAA